MKNQHNPLLSLNTNTSKQEKNTLWLHPRNIGGQIFTMSWVAEYLVWVQQTILWWGLFIFSKVATAHRQQNICIFNNENLVRIMKLSSENASVKWKILKLKTSCNYPLLSVAWLVTREAGRSNCYFPQSRFSCAGWNSCARMSQELRAECVMAGYSQFIKWLQNWWGDSCHEYSHIITLDISLTLPYLNALSIQSAEGVFLQWMRYLYFNLYH